MNTSLLLFAGSLLSFQANVPLADGVYSLCEDVAGYSGETIELKSGKFRYWFYSDVRMEGAAQPKYPITGTYRVSGNNLILEKDKAEFKRRTIAVVNGVDVLWRKVGLELWEKEKRIHPYAILIRVRGATDGTKLKDQPSIRSLYTKEMVERERKEYEQRYNDQPAEVRGLLRAATLEGDSDLATYKREIARAREKLDPVLVRQLIGLMGWSMPTRSEARNILTDIYSSDWLIKEGPAFLKEKDSKKRALGHLIDGLTASRDRKAVEDTLILFLRVSKAEEIDLSIAEAGVRIKLKVLPNGGYSADSGAIKYRSGLPKTWLWTEELPLVIPAVQRWMREQIAK